jgi:prolyl oligopeptidase
MPIDARPTLDAPDDDPWLWLEEVEGERALAFVERQNALTLAKFGGAAFQADRDALAAIYDRPDNIPYITRRGAFVYNTWRDAKNPRGLWRRTALDEFRKSEPRWDIVLDIDRLAQEENEDWILSWITVLPDTHTRAMLSLSRGGGDAVVLREFDIERRAFVTDGFVLAEAKGGAEWLDADTLLLSSAYGGEPMRTTAGYARAVRLWRRGTDVDHAPVLFEVPAESMAASSFVDLTGPAPRIGFVERTGFFDSVFWFGDTTGAKTKLDLPTDIWFEFHQDWMVVKRRSAWTVGGTTYPSDTMLGISLSAFLAGDRNFTPVFEPGPRRALQGFYWAAGRLVLSILDELRPHYEVITPASGWTRSRLPGLPEIGVVDVWRLDAEEAESNGDLLATTQDPLNPSSLALLRDMQVPTLLKRAPRTFVADGLVVSQHEAVSVDGERIPYVQTGPAGETGDAPVHLTGYGGFGLASRPYYNSMIGKLWLERGGTSVIANIRGGGEFGTRWHDAGRRANKRLSHDDFAAVAADLVRRGVTRASRIAAEGGSNGGILISNMLTRYPDRFGALFCTIPLIDMRRYSKLLAGASWIAEYGDPDIAEEWAWLKTYSAYHAAIPGQPYPPILLATTRRDDRVHPGHARKMAAKLQAMGYAAHFYEPAAGGHGYGKDNKERAAFSALGVAFMREAIGWTNAMAHEPLRQL